MGCKISKYLVHALVVVGDLPVAVAMVDRGEPRADTGAVCGGGVGRQVRGRRRRGGDGTCVVAIEKFVRCANITPEESCVGR